MGKAYLSQFNMRDYKGAENINIRIGYQPSDYIIDLATANSNNIYLYQELSNQHNYIISTEDVNDDMLYLNRNMSSICMGLTNLQHTDLINKQKVNYNLVTNLHTSFANCFRLAGVPISSKYTQSMYGTFYNCSNLVGVPQVNANVNNLIGAFYNCQNITGQPNINNNVRMAIDTYYQCDNLIGSPAPEVPAVSIARMYYGCDNIAGSPSNINNALITTMAYYDCPNIYGTFYWDTNGIDQASAVNAYNMFYGRDTSNYLNIYVRPNQCILNALVNYPSTYGAIYGTPLIWTEHTDAHGFPYYTNDSYKTNIYCDYNIININSFSINEMAGYSNGYLHDSQFVPTDYSSIYYKNYVINYYMPHWGGFIKEKPTSYEQKIVLNSQYDISLYKIANFIQNRSESDSINDNYERVWHDDRYFSTEAYVRELRIYYLDYYIYINNYQLNELYFNNANNYNIIIALKHLNNDDNILSDLQFLNIEYQKNYSHIDGIFEKSLLYPIVGNNILNMDNSFRREINTDYIYLHDIINNSIVNTKRSFYPYSQYGSTLVGHIIPYYANFNRNNMKVIPICSDNVISLNNTYRNISIYNDAISGINVLYMCNSYRNSNIDNNIHCGEKVINFDECYEFAISSNPITVCGNNVIYFNGTYNGYRCYQDGQINTRGHEITINIGPNVQYAEQTYRNTYINIKNIIFGPELISAHGLYRGCYSKSITSLPILILPPNLINLSYTFYATNNINNINNFIITHNIENTAACFESLKYIKYPLNLNNYIITESAASMYSDCYNLITIGDIYNIYNCMNYMFYGCNSLNWALFANQNNINIQCGLIAGMFLASGIHTTYDFNININIQDKFSQDIAMDHFLSNINTTENIRLDINGKFDYYSDPYHMLDNINSDILYLNCKNDYIYIKCNNLGFFENCNFNNIIANKPLFICHLLNQIRHQESYPLFAYCNINNLINIYLENITSNSLKTINGITQINFTNSATFFTINNYYATYTWNGTTSITDLYFQHPGYVADDTRYYPRDRYLHFSFGSSHTIGNFSQFNFIFDFSNYVSGIPEESNIIQINFTGYMNGLKMGSAQQIFIQPYLFDTIGDTSGLQGYVYWDVHALFNHSCKDFQLNFTNSIINMNYTLMISNYINYVRQYSTSGTQYDYYRLDGLFYFPSKVNQDEYLQNLNINIGYGNNCPNYIFLYTNLSLDLPVLNNLTINTSQFRPDLDYSTTIYFANKFVNTPNTLDFLNMTLGSDYRLGRFNLLSLNHISTIFKNSNYQSINNFNLLYYPSYNFSEYKWDDDFMNVLQDLESSQWQALNNIKNYTINCSTIRSTIDDGDGRNLDCIWRSIFKILNAQNSQILFNTSHIPYYYNNFENYKVRNLFNFLIDFHTENFIYNQPYFYYPCTSYNSSNLYKNSYLVKSNVNNIGQNYFYNNTKNNLYNKWKDINLYGFYGDNFHNITLTFDTHLYDSICCIQGVKRYSNGSWGETEFSLQSPIGIFYLYNNNFITDNGKMFGDLIWDQISNNLVNSISSGGYSYNNTYQLTYYNINSNVTIKFNIKKYNSG